MKIIHKKIDFKTTNKILKNSTLVEFDETGIKYYGIFVTEFFKKIFKIFKIKINIKTIFFLQMDIK